MLDSHLGTAPADECFVRVPLADAAPAARRDIVLARRDPVVAPDALVIARREERYALCRVARVTDDVLELQPVEGDPPPLRVGPGGAEVLGTVVLRWREG